ncbi:hypothetical protein EON65_40110, partial [archaeon]
MSSKKTRSNSSHAVRASLKKSFVLIPELNPRIDLERYLKLAQTAYDQAVKNTKNKNLPSAYIDFEKFFTLVLDRIPLHPSNKSPGNNVKLVEMQASVKRCTASSIELFEEVLFLMDEEQDKVNEREMEHRLIDAFDVEEEEEVDINLTNSTSTLSTSTIVGDPVESAVANTNCDKKTELAITKSDCSMATYETVSTNMSSLTLLLSPTI